MIKANVYNVLIAPHNTEKATNIADLGKYIFKVACEATREDIKEAVEKVFATKVKKVNVINVEGKNKVFKGRKGKRSGFKKAIVTLEKGKTIDISAGVK
jgi:large subunit ribosomal protein L23